MTFRTAGFYLLSYSIAALAHCADAPHTIVSVDFTVVGWGSDFPQLIYKQDGKDKNLYVPAFRRSESVHYTGKPNLDLILKIPNGDKLVETIVASPLIDPTEKRIMILLGPPVDGKSMVKVLHTPNDELFTGGALRVYNLSPFPMALKVDRETTALAPNQSHLFKSSNGGLIFTTAYEDAQKWQILHDRRLQLLPDKMTTLIYFQTDSNIFKSAGGIELPIQNITLLENKLPPPPISSRQTSEAAVSSPPNS
ncbi:MAG TPA: hypothetical protein VL357_10260 [Rariglobus sp.]|jgi:hypothetical protein|nr:hypothetical protein [Rariglobus sp.]